MKINEVLKEDQESKAYDVGFDDARNYRPRKQLRANPISVVRGYSKGYNDGQAANDHDDWQEKTAAKRQGRHYHESVGEGKRTEHKGYYGTDGTWFPNEEEYAASLKGDPNVEREEESKKKIAETYMYARQGEEFFSDEDYNKASAELQAMGGGMHPSAAAREKYKPFGKLGKLTKPDQVMQHQLAGIPKHEWLFHQQYAGGSEIQCRICGRVQRLNAKGRPINR